MPLWRLILLTSDALLRVYISLRQMRSCYVRRGQTDDCILLVKYVRDWPTLNARAVPVARAWETTTDAEAQK
jgi:hypothetical protein